MYRYLCVFVGALLLWQSAFSQDNQERPEWVDGFFEEARNSYVEVVSAVSYSPEDARKKAMQLILERRSLASGTQAKVQIDGSDVSVTSEHDLIAKARVVDEYTLRLEPGLYRTYLLVQTAKNPTLSFEPVMVTQDYPYSPSVFVPGMAQIYKGDVVKGTCFIAGEVLLLGGVVLSESLRANYASKITQVSNATMKKRYANYANLNATTRNLCIAGAVALYAWNVVDGMVAKGKKRVFIGEMAQFDIAPYATLDEGGLAMNITF
nr:hypothetical protein [Bacteroidales bacterium]